MTRSGLALFSIAVAITAPAAARDVALVGGTVHVGDGKTVLRDATIVVSDGRIASVGRGPAPDGAERLDVRGLHVAPGFIAADTVLGLVEVSAVRSTRDETEVGRVNPHVRAWTAVNPDSELLPVAMANGVLAAVVAPRGGLVSGTSAVLLLDGWTHEDMVLRGPVGMHVDWPSLRVDRSPEAATPVEEQEKRIATELDELDQAFASARAYLAARPAREAGRVPRADRESRWAALEPVLAREIPVVVTADTVAQLRAALAWARRQDVRLVVSGAADGWRVAEELAAAGVPAIVQPVRAIPERDHEPYDTRYRNPVLLHEAGVKVCFSVGRDSFSAAHVRNLPDEAAMTLAFGMPAEAALRAITLSPAEVFGVSDEIGSIEEGKLANLVVWSGPPLEITSRPVHRFLRGVPLADDDKHSRLYRKYAARPSRAE